MPEFADVFPRAWVEFPDPADGEQIIRADLTWLTSRWTCIYGRGCRGIDRSAPAAGCCTHGAHFADKSDEKRVRRWVERLTAADWELIPVGRAVRNRDWIEKEDDGARKTRVVEGACVFQNSPEFAEGAGCALHLLAVRTGESYLDTKPDVCWQLPIRRDFDWRENNDGEQRLVVTITEYTRSMWGPGGHDFDWYCSSDSDAHVADEPVYVTQRPELEALIGPDAYAELAAHCAAHDAARSALRLDPVASAGLCPHPADR